MNHSDGGFGLLLHLPEKLPWRRFPVGSGGRDVRISRVWGVSTSQNHYNYRGLGGAVCVFLVFGTYRPTKTTIIIGVWGARCAYFTCLEGVGRLKTTILIGSGGRVVRISRVWRVSTRQNHYTYKGSGRRSVHISHVWRVLATQNHVNHRLWWPRLLTNVCKTQ